MKSKMWQTNLAEEDFEAIETIAVAHGHSSMIDAIRFALREQVKRDTGETTPRLFPIYSKILAEVVSKQGNSYGGVPMRPWSFRATKLDIASMDRIVKAHGKRETNPIKRRAEAVRFSIRVQATIERSL